MIFNSFQYIFLYLPLMVITYFCLGKFLKGKLSIIFLTFGSLIFYGYWEPKFLLLLAFSILINYLFFLLLKNCSKQKQVLFLSILINLILLFYFKYFIFVIEISNQLLETKINAPSIILPLGISFFTFTQIAFLIDAYRGKIKDMNFINYILFVTFFPHLLAGPIIHHSEMMDQFNDIYNKNINYQNLNEGLILFSIGLFKKTVIADYFVNDINFFYVLTEKTCINFWDAWVATLGYCIQIYFDFSGYTDMALGSALMLNIVMPINFNSPYKAKSIQDFWRRWHITLSRFLKDYLYIPLGGNRINWWRTELNIIIVFILGGIWHGAGYTFVIWGILHAFGYLISKIWLFIKPPLQENRLTNTFYMLLTFMFINFTWVFFRASSITNALNMIKSMFDIWSLTNFNTSIYLIVFLILITMTTPNSMIIKDELQKTNVICSTIIIFVIIFLSLFAIGINNNSPFIYFQF